MENKVIKYQSAAGAEIELSLSIVREMLTDGKTQYTDVEIAQFIELCRYNGLNPFLKEAYLVKYVGKNGDAKCSMIVSKETFLKRAESNPNYDGQKSGIYVQRNGEIIKIVGTLMLQGDVLLGGWAEVYRKDQKVPVEITVSLAEYNTGKNLWASKPATMIRKVALMQALREAFTTQLGACYEESEMPIDTTATVVESKPPTPQQASSPQGTPKAVAPAPQNIYTFKEGHDKVIEHLNNNNLEGAYKGINWLKEHYPKNDVSDLAQKAAYVAAARNEP